MADIYQLGRVAELIAASPLGAALAERAHNSLSDDKERFFAGLVYDHAAALLAEREARRVALEGPVAPTEPR